MQILNLDADLNISRLDADIRTLRLGEGGTTNYNDLTNKPSINSVTLTGNKTTSDLNIKTSDLVNDEGFITDADIPTKTSDLTNDSGFQTAAQVSSAVAAAIPTNVSAFTNDAGYITAAQVGNIPTKTSDLTNDSGFITSAEAPVQSVNGYTGAVSLDGSNLDYSAALSINDKIDAVEAAIPTKTSDLTNDSGFITAISIPTNVSAFTNDAGYITSADIPTDVSAFTNDAGYQTAADVNTLIQAAMPATETIENESIASFSDGADNVPVSELIVDITATQAGSGTPSPSNPRAISGWSSCDVVRNGINQWNEEWELGTLNISDGSEVASSINIRNIGYISALPNTTYYFNRANIAANIFEYDYNHTFIRVQSSPNEFTTSENCRYIRFYMGSAYGTTYNNDISINYPSTDTSYHSYNGTTYPISLGDTYYGGTLNVTTGELTVTHGSVDLGSLTWTLYAGNRWVSNLVTGMKPNASNYRLSGYLCDRFSEVTADQLATDTTLIGFSINTVGNIAVRTGDENTPTGTVVYELATPQTIQLTPTEVRTLLEDNNIFADTGDINELVYFKTGCEAIARLIEAYT